MRMLALITLRAIPYLGFINESRYVHLSHSGDYGEHFDTGCMYVGSQIVNFLF